MHIDTITPRMLDFAYRALYFLDDDEISQLFQPEIWQNRLTMLEHIQSLAPKIGWEINFIISIWHSVQLALQMNLRRVIIKTLRILLIVWLCLLETLITVEQFYWCCVSADMFATLI